MQVPVARRSQSLGACGSLKPGGIEYERYFYEAAA